EKFLDTVAICPSQLGQIGALWGMQNLAQWVAGERAEILDRRAAMVDGFHQLPGWKLLGCGAYFAYVAHPFDIQSNVLAKRLVQEQSLLLLPGTMFNPAGQGTKDLRIAFANVDRAGIAEVFRRLAAFSP
ncbi:MAG: aminotransferase class I/II-fold pyridoxal phosphate-dependent enzyme, partial [Paracoccaceae bacterium]